MKPFVVVLILGTVAVVSGCSPPKKENPPSPLALKINRFAPIPLRGDVSKLSAGDRQALGKLIQAALIMDKIFTRQVWSGNEALRARLENDATPEARELLHYYNINFGPWSKLDHDEAFIDGAPKEKPQQANYYPDDMTKEEFTSWVATLPEKEKKKALGFFYTIRRDANGKLKTVPYSEEYRDLLLPAVTLLREAATFTENASLKKYLNTRADAFESNDYYESDVAWMDLDSPIEPTIGPYEVYMDELFNYKAAFEAYICLRDDAETAKLAKISAHLQDIENNLPIAGKYRNPKIGAMAPIRVVDEVALGGEARAGVQTAAFNLPNDERVTEEKGSKRVMLKNVQEAKFRAILIPIARIAIDEGQLPSVAFEPFFTGILAHELMHGLGPHNITVNGKKTTARQALRELSSAFEEAKADISGLFAVQYLIDKGVFSKTMEQQLYVTFLTGIFRAVRYGLNEAHGKGVAMQFNYLMDEGAVVLNPSTGRFSVNTEKFKAGAKKLTGEIMTIQALGSYEKAKSMMDTYGVIRPVMKKTLDSLAAVPVDIEPLFTQAE